MWTQGLCGTVGRTGYHRQVVDCSLGEGAPCSDALRGGVVCFAVAACAAAARAVTCTTQTSTARATALVPTTDVLVISCAANMLLCVRAGPFRFNTTRQQCQVRCQSCPHLLLRINPCLQCSQRPAGSHMIHFCAAAVPAVGCAVRVAGGPAEQLHGRRQERRAAVCGSRAAG